MMISNIQNIFTFQVTCNRELTPIKSKIYASRRVQNC